MKKYIHLNEGEMCEYVRELVKEHLLLINETEDVVNRGFRNVYDDRGSVQFITHNNGTIQVIFTSNCNNKNEAVQIAYESFIVKLKPFINTANKNGFNIMLSAPKVNDGELILYMKIIDGEGNIKSSIAKEGWEYCATVIPIQGMEENALVTIAPKYQNTNIGNIIKNTGVAEKCVGCGRTIKRSQYVIYINTTNGEIVKLGTNCAVNKFGYCLNNKFINRLAMMFNTCNYHDLVAHDPDGDVIEPRLSLTSVSNRTYVDAVMKSVYYHGMMDPYFNIKEYGYEKIQMDASIMTKIPCDKEGLRYYTYFHGKRYENKFTPIELDMRKWYENNAQNVPTFEEYKEFWDNKQPVGDWEKMCYTVAHAMMGEGQIPSKFVEKFEKILPYTMLMFIREKNGKNNSSVSYKPGDVIENLRCRLAETTYSNKYEAYFVKVKDNEDNLFGYWSKRDTTGLGSQELIIKSGIVNKIMNGGVIGLSKVDIISVDKDEKIRQRNEVINSLQYPADKTRLKNVPMKVLEFKLTQDGQKSSVTLEDISNGCKYYIFLIKNYNNFAPRVIDFPYEVNDTVNITGTVERKEGRNGIYYVLSRVKIG